MACVWAKGIYWSWGPGHSDGEGRTNENWICWKLEGGEDPRVGGTPGLLAGVDCGGVGGICTRELRKWRRSAGVWPTWSSDAWSRRGLEHGNREGRCYEELRKVLWRPTRQSKNRIILNG